MSELPCLIFDEHTHLLAFSVDDWFLYDFGEPAEAEDRFLGSLRSGDRKRFKVYCSEPLDPDSDSVPCELFSLCGLSSLRYAFCEKNASGSRLLNTVFLAEQVDRFYPLMSPVSLGYSRTTDRMIRELLLLLGTPDAYCHSLTPETILALRCLPTVLQSLKASHCGSGFCDVFRLTDLVVRNLSESPLFLNTLLRCPSREADPMLRIIELPAELYVHILTSVLTALLTVSSNHAITVEVRPFAVFVGTAPLSIDVKISTGIRDPDDYRNDSSTLRSLAVPDSAEEMLLAVASVLAYAAGIETSVNVDHSAKELKVYLTLNPEGNRQVPGLKFRAPYQIAEPVLAEFFAFRKALQTIPQAGSGRAESVQC